MAALIDVILPVFLVIGFGYVAVWKGYFSDSGVDGLMKFTQGFAIPCLLFRAISHAGSWQQTLIPPACQLLRRCRRWVCHSGLLGARYCSGAIGKTASRSGFAACFPIRSCWGCRSPNAPMGVGA